MTSERPDRDRQDRPDSGDRRGGGRNDRGRAPRGGDSPGRDSRFRSGRDRREERPRAGRDGDRRADRRDGGRDDPRRRDDRSPRANQGHGNGEDRRDGRSGSGDTGRGERRSQQGRDALPGRADDRAGRREDRDGRGSGRGREDRDRRRDDGRRDDRRGTRRSDQRPDRGAGSAYRPGQEARQTRPREPEFVAGLDGRELDGSVRGELRTLSKETAERVAKHMVSAGFLLQERELEAARDHSAYAVRLAGRVGAVRELHGIVSYQCGDFGTALRELRAARRINGGVALLPLIADCERGLGKPEKTLEIASSAEAAELDEEQTLEMRIVVAGAHADAGDLETALGTLETPQLTRKLSGAWPVRLWYAYSQLLDVAGRRDDARKWLTLAADADTKHLTTAGEELGRPAPADPDLPWADDERISVIDTLEELTSAAVHETADKTSDGTDKTTDSTGEPSDGEPSDAADETTDSTDESPDAAETPGGGDEPSDPADDAAGSDDESRASADDAPDAGDLDALEDESR